MLSALPYFVMAVMGILFSHLSQILQRKEVLRLSFSRKLFNSIGLYVPMLALIALAFITKEQAMAAVTLLTVAVGINAATYLGFQVNHIDLAPNHAGVLMGITNCAANIMSIIAPLAVGYIVSESVSYWRRTMNVLTNDQQWNSFTGKCQSVEDCLFHFGWHLLCRQHVVCDIRKGRRPAVEWTTTAKSQGAGSWGAAEESDFWFW